MDLFFEDLALPRLLRTHIASTLQYRTRRAGYNHDGTPHNLAVLRTMRGALGRRMALTKAPHRELQALQPDTTRVIACGGGVRNPVLMRAIAACLPGVVVESSAAHGLDPDFVEAMAFAWLARETLAGRPGNLPAVTGAAGPRVLGVVHPAQDRSPQERTV